MQRNRKRADGPGATSDSTNENSIMISQEGITMTHMRLRKILRAGASGPLWLSHFLKRGWTDHV